MRPRAAAVRFLAVARGGKYVRVADPSWKDPLSGDFARRLGGRRNPPGGFAVVYLNRRGRPGGARQRRAVLRPPYGPEDLEPAAAPVLVSTDVEPDEFADVVSDAGCVAAGLPATYPTDSGGRTVNATRTAAPSAGQCGTRGCPASPAAAPRRQPRPAARSWHGSPAVAGSR